MLLQKRTRLDGNGHIEFHATGDCVECRVFNPDGKPDTESSKDCHAILRIGIDEMHIASCLSETKMSQGRITFPKEIAALDWSVPLPQGEHQFEFFDDTKLRQYIQHLESLKELLNMMLTGEWSGKKAANQ